MFVPFCKQDRDRSRLFGFDASKTDKSETKKEHTSDAFFFLPRLTQIILVMYLLKFSIAYFWITQHTTASTILKWLDVQHVHGINDNRDFIS